MSEQVPSADQRLWVDDSILKVNSSALTEEFLLSSTENQSACRCDICPLSSSAITSENGGREPFPVDTTPSFPDVITVPITFIELYVRAVISEVGEFQENVVLMKCVAGTRDVVASFRDGVAAIEVPWFSTLRGLLLKALKAAELRMEEVQKKSFQYVDGETEIDIWTARKLFAQYLREMTDKVVHGYYYHLRLHQGRRLLELQALFEHISDRWMQNLFKNQDRSPCILTELSMNELNAVLIRDFEGWISMIFPYLRYAFSSWQPIRFLWLEGNSVKKEEVAFQVYYAATRKNLLYKEGVGARGVLFPIKWMHELLYWLCNNDVGALEPPGPFDTFQLMELSSDDPVKHIVREGNDEFDVIPEGLFDLLWTLFGGGPKYLVTGMFRMRDIIREQLKPPRVSLSVVFEGLCESPVQLDYILHRTRLSEVFRRALYKLQQQEQYQGQKSDTETWRAALCAKDGVEAHVTHVYGRTVDDTWVVSLLNRQRVGELLEQKGTNFPSENSKGAPALQVSLYMKQQIDHFDLKACGVCGLANIGNTCYMNSALQCLSNMNALRHSLFSLPLSEYATPAITKEMVELLLDMWSGTLRKTEPRRLKAVIGRQEKRFDLNDQQDAMEFIEVLLDHMHEEMNSVSCKSYRERLESDAFIPTVELSRIFREDFLYNNSGFIPRLFFHQSKTCFKCLTCGVSTTVFDNNPTISLTVVTPVKRRTFEVVLLMPTAQRVRLRVIVTCDKNGVVHAADLVREITNCLVFEDVVANSTRTSVSVSAFLPNGEGGVDKNGNGNGTSDTGERGGSMLDGCRVLLHADHCKPLPDDGTVFYAAIVSLPLESVGKNVSVEEATMLLERERAETKEAEKEKEEEEEEGESEVILWYFLKARRVPFYSQHELCYVERISRKNFSSYLFMATHILNRGRGLVQRFLTDIFSSGNEVQSLSMSLSTEDPVSCGNARHMRVFYQTRRYDIVHQICEENFEEGRRKWEAVNTDYANTSELRFLVEYDDFAMRLRDDFCCLTHTSAQAVGSSTSCTSTSYCRELDNAVSIEECLESTFSPDTLTGDDARFCDKCNVLRDSRVERSLFLLPPCLIISLKRFKVHVREVLKNNTPVKFSMKLDMSPYLDVESQERDTKYSLRGVVTHRGFISMGHYTASTLNDNANQWFHYDDLHISPLPEGPSVRDAFILCYERDGSEVIEESDTNNEKE